MAEFKEFKVTATMTVTVETHIFDWGDSSFDKESEALNSLMNDFGKGTDEEFSKIEIKDITNDEE